MSTMFAAVHTTVDNLRRHLTAVRREGGTIALVPTMGALHGGHLSLIAQAAESADVVVVSVFVNPAQFNESADLDAYPRGLAHDISLATAAGASVVFAPSVDEIYPQGFCTQVTVSGPLTETLDGAHRGSSHFHGVTTVVTKLLTIAAPDIAVFGSKDAQQLLVIERLVSDLHLPVKIVHGETIRDSDGLAMSSRNAQLSHEGRAQALGINRALVAAVDAHRAGGTTAATILTAARSVLDAHDIEPEYLALCDAATLEPLDELPQGQTALVLMAAPVDGVRLIDNLLIN